MSGIKRHIIVDTQGFPHAWAVTTANITDRAGALNALGTHHNSLSEMTNLLADGGYTGEPFTKGVKELTGSSVEIVKRSKLHNFAVMPKRWIVERSLAWLKKCRRLWKNCERKLNASLQLMVIAFLRIIIKNIDQFLREQWRVHLSLLWPHDLPNLPVNLRRH